MLKRTCSIRVPKTYDFVVKYENYFSITQTYLETCLSTKSCKRGRSPGILQEKTDRIIFALLPNHCFFLITTSENSGGSVVVDLLFNVTPIAGVCNCSMFCCRLLYVHSSFAIILMGKRELVALLSLSSWCLMIAIWLFLAVPWVCLQFVIVVFPDHTRLLFPFSCVLYTY